MIRKSLKLVAVAITIFVCLQTLTVAQTKRTSKPAAPGLMSLLPESDAVAQVKVNRLLSEVMPKLRALA